MYSGTEILGMDGRYYGNRRRWPLSLFHLGSNRWSSAPPWFTLVKDLLMTGVIRRPAYPALPYSGSLPSLPVVRGKATMISSTLCGRGAITNPYTWLRGRLPATIPSGSYGTYCSTNKAAPIHLLLPANCVPTNFTTCATSALAAATTPPPPRTCMTGSLALTFLAPGAQVHTPAKPKPPSNDLALQHIHAQSS